MHVFQMETLVRKCQTIEGARDLAAFMCAKFPAQPRLSVKQWEFVTVIKNSGAIEVHCEFPVNDMGKEIFKELVHDFCETKRNALGVTKLAPQRIASSRQQSFTQPAEVIAA